MEDLLTGVTDINKDIEKQLACISQVGMTACEPIMMPPPQVQARSLVRDALLMASEGGVSGPYDVPSEKLTWKGPQQQTPIVAPQEPAAFKHPALAPVLVYHQQYHEASSIAAQQRTLARVSANMNTGLSVDADNVEVYDGTSITAPTSAEKSRHHSQPGISHVVTSSCAQEPQVGTMIKAVCAAEQPRFSKPASVASTPRTHDPTLYKLSDLQPRMSEFLSARTSTIKTSDSCRKSGESVDDPPCNKRKENNVTEKQGGAGWLLPSNLDDDLQEELGLQLPSSDLERYEVLFESEVKLGMLLERRLESTSGSVVGLRTYEPQERSNVIQAHGQSCRELTIVTMVIEGGAASKKGVIVGSRLLAINEVESSTLPYARCLELVKNSPRPLRLVFERSRISCDTAKGWCLVRKSPGTTPPTTFSSWNRAYFVIGGAVAKRHVLQLYESKAQYEDIVVRMFQGQSLSGYKYKAYALTASFKCSLVFKKTYSLPGQTLNINYFALRNPHSRTKTMKLASENPSIVHALHSHVLRFASTLSN